MSNTLRLIVIDDEPIIINQFKKMDIWEKSHFTLVECFSDAEDAEEYMVENPVDIVICDIRLPGMSGLEFAEIIKNNYPQTMFVLMSAYSEFEYAQQAISLGVREYLVKPLRKNEILSCLNNLYKSAPARVITKNSEILIFQQILLSIVTGVIDNEEALLTELTTYSLPKHELEHPVIFLNVHINSFEDYLSGQWKYGRTRLYNAISFILNQPILNHNLYLTRYCNDDFECAIISKNNCIKNTSEIFDTIKVIFSSTLNMDVQITLQSEFESVLSVINKTTNSPMDKKNNFLFNVAIKYIDDNYTNSQLDLNLVAQKLYLSKKYFSHIFKQKMGVNFVSYLNKVRIEKSKPYVIDTNVKISSIYEYVGYKNSRYFYKNFKELTGLTPLQYREKYSNTL